MSHLLLPLLQVILLLRRLSIRLLLLFLHLLLQMIRATSDDSSIRRMLETVMTVQAANGQLLVDMLDELRSLQANLESFRRSPLPPPFDDES